MKTKLLAACTAAAAVTGPLCAEELVYGTYAHSEHYNNRVTAAGVFDRVAAATNGDITVKIMSGGVVAGAKETLEAIQTGLIDMGAVITTYNAGDLPATQFIGNFHTTDQRIAAPALTETVLLGCPQCTREAVENGVSLQLFASSVPAVLLCASKPVETLADLAGMRVRASGAVADRFAAMGAVPVIVSPSEIYEALQRGNVDCHSVALTGARKLATLGRGRICHRTPGRHVQRPEPCRRQPGHMAGLHPRTARALARRAIPVDGRYRGIHI